MILFNLLLFVACGEEPKTDTSEKTITEPSEETVEPSEETTTEPSEETAEPSEETTTEPSEEDLRFFRAGKYEISRWEERFCEGLGEWVNLGSFDNDGNPICEDPNSELSPFYCSQPEVEILTTGTDTTIVWKKTDWNCNDGLVDGLQTFYDEIRCEVGESLNDAETVHSFTCRFWDEGDEGSVVNRSGEGIETTIGEIYTHFNYEIHFDRFEGFTNDELWMTGGDIYLSPVH